MRYAPRECFQYISALITHPQHCCPLLCVILRGDLRSLRQAHGLRNQRMQSAIAARLGEEHLHDPSVDFLSDSFASADDDDNVVVVDYSPSPPAAKRRKVSRTNASRTICLDDEKLATTTTCSLPSSKRSVNHGSMKTKATVVSKQTSDKDGNKTTLKVKDKKFEKIPTIQSAAAMAVVLVASEIINYLEGESKLKNKVQKHVSGRKSLPFSAISA